MSETVFRQVHYPTLWKIFKMINAEKCHASNWLGLQPAESVSSHILHEIKTRRKNKPTTHNNNRRQHQEERSNSKTQRQQRQEQ